MAMATSVVVLLLAIAESVSAFVAPTPPGRLTTHNHRPQTAQSRGWRQPTSIMTTPEPSAGEDREAFPSQPTDPSELEVGWVYISSRFEMASVGHSDAPGRRPSNQPPSPARHGWKQCVRWRVAALAVHQYTLQQYLQPKLDNIRKAYGVPRRDGSIP